MDVQDQCGSLNDMKINFTFSSIRASLVAQMVKNEPAMQETWVQSLGQEDSPGEGNGNPLQYSCLENPMDGGAWWATVHGVTKSRTRLSDFTFTFRVEMTEILKIPERLGSLLNLF